MTLQIAAQIAQIISTTAITLSAFVAMIVLIYTRRTNRRRATLDMVMRTFLDERGTKLYDAFIALYRRNEDGSDQFRFVDMFEYSKEVETDRNTVIDQLNNYELVALGIRRGLFDEGFYKHWFHGQFLKDCRALVPLIEKVQAERPSTYCELTALMNKWEKEPHPENHPYWHQKVWWAITGNDGKLRTAVAVMKRKAKRGA